MNLNHTLLVVAFASVSALGIAPNAAHAGSLDNAAVACFVDTYAFDQSSIDYCGAVWSPGAADLQTTAYFEVVGLPPGNFSYHWDADCNSNTTVCTAPISARPEGFAKRGLVIVDNNTGEEVTVSAFAEYLNGWD